MHGELTWIDLSTFDVPKTKSFYRSVFKWDYAEGDAGYVNCLNSSVPAAGLYEMPEFFQKIKMPSFWMTYIKVSDINAVASSAKKMGGKVEMETTNALGKVALIRDPAGAGFTCFEGDSESAIAKESQNGRWFWSELFVSDLSLIKTFYSELFAWSFEEDQDTPDRFWIMNGEGGRMSAVQVAGNETKGDKEFWGVFFGVRNAESTLDEVRRAGGEVAYEYSNSGGRHNLVYDPQGAAFFVTDQGGSQSDGKSISKQSQEGGVVKWRSLIGLVVIYLAILFEMDWLWGALFLIWVVPDLKSGITYFIEPLSRRKNPILYWSVILTWIGLSAYLIISAF